MDKIIKIGIAIFFFLCLADMPYNYFQLVRFLAFMGFCFLAYKSNQQEKTNGVFLYVGLALLFQPFFKIALGRELWNVIDVVVAIGLLWSLFQKNTGAKQ